MSFLSGVGDGLPGATIVEPSMVLCDARFGGATRDSRQRQLPTNHGHAALPSATRGYQLDSSSKPPLELAVGAAQELPFAQ
jgi:hypothetical protein